MIKLRRIAGALALLGAVLHATLLPGHFAFISADRSADAQLTADLASAICHGTRGAVGDDGSRSPDGKVPCPICLGLAAMGSAMLAEPVALLDVPSSSERVATPQKQVLVRSIALAHPRNRGPPLI